MRRRPVLPRGTGRDHGRPNSGRPGPPADNIGNDDPTITLPRRLPPPTNGSVFRVVEYPPDKERFAAMSGQDWSARCEKPRAIQRTGGAARHPGFHKTDTIDYALVLEGEVFALIDEGETLMQTGDVLIQRGTYHAWDNRSDRRRGSPSS